jgi:two-component system chemotaxis response regulator CheY
MGANSACSSCGAEINIPVSPEGGKPLCLKCKESVTPPPQNVGVSLLKLKTLIVDDSGVSRRALRFLLESMGCEVTETSDAVKGMEKALTMNPDVILLDFHMPVKDGLALLKELKSNPATRGAQVVMHTVESEKDVIIECMRAGASDYIVKPVQKLVLYTKLRRLAEKIQARAASH